jgi:hypothetical protein
MNIIGRQSLKDGDRMLANYAGRKKAAVASTLVLALTIGGLGCVPADATDAPEQASRATSEMRLLTGDQYKASIADIFGSSVSIPGRFDPIIRDNGLLAVGAAGVDMTPAAFERYEGLARTVASQALNQSRRQFLVPCKPQSEKKPSDACARQFFASVGRFLFRRPLTTEELRTAVATASAATKGGADFYAGLEPGLSALLMSPNFLFVVSQSEPDPKHPNSRRLADYSKAARLSFFFWNTTPDDELLSAAEKGELRTERGIENQIDRLINSPRLEQGVRAFFDDMLSFEDIDALTKDAVIFPAYTPAVAIEAREQTLRMLTDLLVTRKGDYRDVFTDRFTYLSPALARVYRIPINDPAGGLVRYEFPEGDPRAGLVSQISFLALNSHPGRSSPTRRGRAVREILLCQKVPDPPANVKFDLFNDPNSPNKTARDRLAAHAQNPVCAGCHKITDPIGLTLENFDGLGQFREAESGAPINVSGQLNSVKFSGAAGLAKALHDEPAATSCLVNRLYSYAVGHKPDSGSAEILTGLKRDFAVDGYRVPALMRRIAHTDTFFQVNAIAQSGPQSGPPRKGDAT